jgi:two-component system, NtrC family, response regulator AtoC
MDHHPLSGLSILVLEDETLLRKQVAAALEHMGMDVTGVATLAAARQVLGQLSFDFVLLDVNLPDGLGTNLLKERAFSPSVCVVVMTANGGVAGAVEALHQGAADYLVKPFDPAELGLVLNRARKVRQHARVAEYRQEADGIKGFYFGASLHALETQLQKIIAADTRMQADLPPILIHGETGTGKTTIARWVHSQGPRADQPLVEVNCSALPETLAESELFGHERGAFTDARSARMGLFEAANGGTLFLDELPSLSPVLQAKVLMAIEDHKVRRVGANKPITVDVRLIAATNLDLKAAVAEGRFREDLYHRLDLFRIFIPPLRERAEDVLKLAELLSERLCRRHRLPVRAISERGRRRLLAYRWPGNVRELAHELERAIVFDDSNELDFNHLAGTSMATAIPAGDPGLNSSDWLNAAFEFPADGFQLEDAINRLIQKALQQTGGNVSGAARLLGVTRDYVRYRLNGDKSQA